MPPNRPRAAGSRRTRPPGAAKAKRAGPKTARPEDTKRRAEAKPRAAGSPWWGWAAFGVILLAALWLRLIAVQETIVPHPLRADAAEYYLTGYNLAVHGVYSQSPRGLNPDGEPPLAPDAARYPGLPLIISALVWANAGVDYAGRPSVYAPAILHDAQMLNVIAGVAAVGLVFVAARAALPLWAALGAALLTALSPHLVSFTVYLLTEPIAAMLVSLLLAGVAAIAARREGDGGLRADLGIGVLVGVLALFRAMFLLAAPVLMLALLGRRGLPKTLAAALFGTVVAVAPWFVRNAVSIPAQPAHAAAAGPPGGMPNVLLVAATSPAAAPGGEAASPLGWIVDGGTVTLGDRAGSKVAGAMREIAYRFGVDPLGAIAWYGFGTIRRLWQWDNVDGAGDVFIYPVTETPFADDPAFRLLHDAMRSLHWVIVGLALAGSILAWTPGSRDLLPRRGRPVVRAASLLLAYTTLVLVPFYTCTRYAVPVFPALFLMAMVPPAIAATLAARWRARREARAA